MALSSVSLSPVMTADTSSLATRTADARHAQTLLPSGPDVQISDASPLSAWTPTSQLHAGSIESYDAGSPDSADLLANTSYSDNGGASIITAAGPATAGVIPTSTSGTDNTGGSLTFLGNGVVQGPTSGRRLLSQ